MPYTSLTALATTIFTPSLCLMSTLSAPLALYTSRPSPHTGSPGIRVAATGFAPPLPPPTVPHLERRPSCEAPTAPSSTLLPDSCAGIGAALLTAHTEVASLLEAALRPDAPQRHLLSKDQAATLLASLTLTRAMISDARHLVETHGTQNGTALGAALGRDYSRPAAFANELSTLANSTPTQSTSAPQHAWTMPSGRGPGNGAASPFQTSSDWDLGPSWAAASRDSQMAWLMSSEEAEMGLGSAPLDVPMPLLTSSPDGSPDCSPGESPDRSPDRTMPGSPLNDGSPLRDSAADRRNRWTKPPSRQGSGYNSQRSSFGESRDSFGSPPKPDSLAELSLSRSVPAMFASDGSIANSVSEEWREFSEKHGIGGKGGKGGGGGASSGRGSGRLFGGKGSGRLFGSGRSQMPPAPVPVPRHFSDRLKRSGGSDSKLLSEKSRIRSLRGGLMRMFGKLSL